MSDSVYNVPETSSTIERELDADETLSAPRFSHSKGDKHCYDVQIATGKQVGAQTNADAYVTLVGDKAKTGQISLRGFFDFLTPIARDTLTNLLIKTDEDLGKILVVIVGCKGSWLEDQWYVNSVSVVDRESRELQHFPCYHWIGKDDYVSITAETTTRINVAGNKILLDQRDDQLKKRKAQYKWQMFPDSGIPSGIDDSVENLPPDEQFGAVKNIDFTTDGMKAFGLLKAAGLFITVDSLNDYEKLAKVNGGDTTLFQAGRWTSDIEFGRQMMNAVNPIIIKKCDSLPPNFPVTDEMVKPFIQLTLQEEMAAGHIYICDLKIMDGLKAREGYVNVAPICLLHVDQSKQLVPIAIQLKQGVREEEKQNNPIFLPSDSWIDWLLAKIYYQSAHSQLHQLFTHYTSCHATMEVYAMGTMRNLPDPHPIFKLLRPHFRYTIAINSRARASLINSGGIIDTNFGIGGEGLVTLFQRCGETYNVHTSNIKRFAKERGVDNAEQLPGYYYRDDGIKVWDALEGYVGEIINEFYKTDEDVLNDEELQAWAEDIHTYGFPGYKRTPDGHGFPNKMSSKEELKLYCTLIMFTGSAQHASINFEQYFYYKFVPNAPFGVRQPPPTEKGTTDFQYLLDTLPEEDTAINSIGITSTLSQYSTNELFLGDYKHRFTEERALAAQEKFKKVLLGVSGDIEERNKGLDIQYTAMLPGKVPNSITI